MMEREDWKNFKNLVLKASGFDNPLDRSDRKIRIENRLREIFPEIRHVPENPTYATMILKAITDLNEEMGSSPEAISDFMRNEYTTLPWAHSTILKHHLKNLSVTGEIKVTDDLKFMLPKNPAEANLASKRNKVGKVNKMTKDWGMGVAKVEKQHQRPKIILKFKLPNSDATDGSHGCEEQLGRGLRNKVPRSKSLFNFDQKHVENPTPRKRRSVRPARFRNPTQTNEALQFGGERKHTRFFLPHELNEEMPSDKRAPLETTRISVPIARPKGRPPKSNSMNDGVPKFSAAIPEGIIIALPAQPKKQLKKIRQTMKV